MAHYMGVYIVECLEDMLFPGEGRGEATKGSCATSDLDEHSRLCASKMDKFTGNIGR